MVSIKNSKEEYISRTLEVLPGLVLCLLCESDWQINEQNIEGKTLMHVAAQMNKPDVGVIFDGLCEDGSSFTHLPPGSYHSRCLWLEGNSLLCL